MLTAAVCESATIVHLIWLLGAMASLPVMAGRQLPLLTSAALWLSCCQFMGTCEIENPDEKKINVDED